MTENRILVIEPYYGGSHQAFLQGLMANVHADYTLLSLPARSWKTRMQLAAPWFARQVAELPEGKRWFSVVLCSTFVDVGALRAMLHQLEGWNHAARFCTYFHENQFAYPNRLAHTANRQFQYLNFTSAVISDRLAFNSVYNRDTFLRGCRKYLQKAGELRVEGLLEEITCKSCVLPPGIDFAPIDSAMAKFRLGAPVIVWNHRWEHDKNPEEFFRVLRSLKSRGIDFGLVVLGQSFSAEPDCFREARTFFQDRILHFGYAESKDDYGGWLKQGAIVVSTARHEFFGISVIEAVRAGCRPLLPRRLSYPELFPETFLYGDGELESRLAALLAVPQKALPLHTDLAVNFSERFSWSRLAQEYGEWLFEESSRAVIFKGNRRLS